MIRKVYLSFLLTILCGFAWAQSREVSGRVTKEGTGEALSGVSVTIKGNSRAATTNAEGQFTITIPGTNTTLVFSYVGHASREVPVGNRSTVDVVLQEQATSTLNDVVVIGYAAVSRDKLTSAVSSVGARQLRDVPLSSAAEAITGRLAGVQVTTSEGAPGADILIRVRGGGSITQDNSPIYIVDGVQVENALSTLSPQDIQSIDVLKDASSTAIYGARGANGVVIITTKSGRAGKTSVSYNGSFGFREVLRKMEVMNPYDFVTWQWERRLITGDTARFAYGSTWDTLNVYKDIQNIDWQEEVFGRKGGYQNHNLAISGGSPSTTYNLSLTANDEEGILLQSGFSRKLVNFKLDHRAPNNKLRVGFNVRYLDQVIKGAGTTSSGSRTNNRLRNTIQYRPFEIPILPGAADFDEDYYSRSNLTNPVILTGAEYRRTMSDATNLSGYFSYQLLKDLTFRSNFGFDRNSRLQNTFNSRITGAARQYSGMPVAIMGTNNLTTINNSNTLNWSKKKFREHHDIDVLLGQEIYETQFRTTTTETRYLPMEITAEKAFANMQLGSPPAGAQQARPFSFQSPANRMFSLFGRLNYAYEDKYLATFSLRADRSSKFRYEKGQLYFPSGSLAWRFTREKFMENVNFLSDGKLRFGYGTAGNNRIADLLYLQLFRATGEYALGNTLVPALLSASLSNPDLQWERTISQNVGLDLGFLNNRLTLTVDAYYNKTKDLLLDLAIPATTGYSTQIKNVAATSSRGVEFQLNGDVVRSKALVWSSNFNLSFNRNRVESLGPIQQRTANTGLLGRDGADEYLLKVGEPVGLMYGFVTDGFYKVEDFNYVNGAYVLKAGQPNTQLIFGAPQPGTIKLKNLGGDSLIRVEDDRAVIGNANPKFTGGWGNQFSYKNFDASIFVNWVVGNDIFNANRIEWTDASFSNMNMLAEMNNRWKNINEKGELVTNPQALSALNANASIWSPTRANRYYLHSYAVEDGSFLRINNLTVGYTVPSALLQRVKLSQFRVYATVNNLATFTNYSGYDPEVTTRLSNPLTPGVDMAGYPRSKTFVFGLNVTF